MEETIQEDLNKVPDYTPSDLKEAAQEILNARESIEQGIIPEDYAGPERMRGLEVAINRFKLMLYGPCSLCHKADENYTKNIEWVLYQSEEILKNLQFYNQRTTEAR